jgi:aspartate racemase
VRIQGGKSRPPIFCLPGNLGNVYTDLGLLSRHLGQDQPFYGLQDGLGHPSKIEALAAHYIEDIRHLQPEGPFFLAGICSGGVVAFEMAQQLLEGGQPVALLALIEPATLSLPEHTHWDLLVEIWERSTRRISGGARDLPRLSLLERITYVRLKKRLIANILALKYYHPRPYRGRFHLLLTKESHVGSYRLGWRELATGEAKVHEIRGSHRSITGDRARIEEDEMRALGRTLRECIDEALMDAQKPR